MFDQPVINLSWARSGSPEVVCNFGDALSPLIVSACLHKPCILSGFISNDERLVSTGTIGSNIKDGYAQVWGSGFDANDNADHSGVYTLPSNTKLKVHAVRGKNSAALLNNFGIETPDVYGDPASLLPYIITDIMPKSYELGVIVHISEIDSYSENAQVIDEFVRYQIPKSYKNDIKIINTLCEPTLEGVKSKIDEIRACKRIATTSLHGAVIPEAFGIPCTYFSMSQDLGPIWLNLNDPESKVDHRFRDLYTGLGLDYLSAYSKFREHSETNWDDLMRFIDSSWYQKDMKQQKLLDALPSSKQPCSWDELKAYAVF